MRLGLATPKEVRRTLRIEFLREHVWPRFEAAPETYAVEFENGTTLRFVVSGAATRASDSFETQ